MSHTLQKKRIVRGVIAGALALAAVAGVSQNAWANTSINGLTISGQGITGSSVSTNDGDVTINSGAGNIEIAGTASGATTIKLDAGYTGTITFSGVSATEDNTLTIAASSGTNWPTSGVNIAFSGTNTITTPAASGLLGKSSDSSAPTVPVTITTNTGSTTTIQGASSATTSTILTNGANLTFAGPGSLTVVGGANTQNTETAVVAIGANNGTIGASGQPPKGVITFASGSNVTAKGGEATSNIDDEAIWATGGLVVEENATLTATASAGPSAGGNGAIGINLVANTTTGDNKYGSGKVAASTIAGTVKTTGGASLATNTSGQSGLVVSANDALTVTSTGSLTAMGGATTNTGSEMTLGNAEAYNPAIDVRGSLTSTGTITATGGASNISQSQDYMVVGSDGLEVNSGASLTSTGTLTLTGGDGNCTGAMAANGGNGLYVDSGAKTVSLGGTVNATGGKANVTSAKSPGSYEGDDQSSNKGQGGLSGMGMWLQGDVTFNGTITATGGENVSKVTYNANTGNGIQATSNITVSGGTLSATGGSGAYGFAGNGIVLGYNNDPGELVVNDGAVNATSGTYATEGQGKIWGGSSWTNLASAGLGLGYGSNLRLLGGSLNAQGANSTGPNVPGGIGILVDGTGSGSSAINITAGSLNAQGGNGPTAIGDGSTGFNYTGWGLWVKTSGVSCVMNVENYAGTEGEGPTVNITGGQTLGTTSTGETPYQERAIGANNDGSNGTFSLNLYDGVNSKNSSQDVFYPWLVLTGKEDVPNTVQGLAGMSAPVNSMTVTSSSPLQHSILIEPAPLTALGLGVNGEYATTGTVLTPTIQNGTFTTPEGKSETYEFANDSLVTVGAMQPGENYTVSAKGNEATINEDATGNETTVTAATPSSIQELYEDITEATETIPMTYPITLNGNGGTFPLYTSNSTESIRPSNFTEVTLYTQPGTGKLLPYGVSNVGLTNSYYSMTHWAQTNGVGGENPASPTMEQLQEVLGALPEATTTNQETPYFQGWFTEAEGGERSAQPFDTTQTIYAQFGAEPPAQEPGKVTIYRLYNPYSHEHLFTKDVSERDGLMDAGWQGEGVAWIAPDQSETPVYRLYNRYNQDHYYCTSSEEANYLESLGWTYDFERGAAFYGAPQTEVPIYQLFNPYETTNTHLWTGNFTEYTDSQALGWKGEGTVWYALSLS